MLLRLLRATAAQRVGSLHPLLQKMPVWLRSLLSDHRSSRSGIYAAAFFQLGTCRQHGHENPLCCVSLCVWPLTWQWSW